NEFNEQSRNGILQNVKEPKPIKEKQITIKYTNTRTNAKCELIIGTIDSLMVRLGIDERRSVNYFTGIINSIIDGSIEKQRLKRITYGRAGINLNKHVCLICDETQDLPEAYGKAIIEL